MDLEVADRLPVLLDDPRLDVGTREPLLHLRAGERLVVPVARDLGIRVPGDEAVDVVRAGRPQRRQVSETRSGALPLLFVHAKEDRMPGKRPSVKNEKQYEKLKEKGMSKERAAKIANSPGASSRGGKASGSGVRRHNSTPGRHDRAEEGRRPQGRPRHRAQELTRPSDPPARGRIPRGDSATNPVAAAQRIAQLRKGRTYVDEVLAPQPAHPGAPRPRYVLIVLALCALAGSLVGGSARPAAAAGITRTSCAPARRCLRGRCGASRCTAPPASSRMSRPASTRPSRSAATGRPTSTARTTCRRRSAPARPSRSSTPTTTRTPRAT